METKSDSPIIIKNDDGLFQLLDDNHHTLESKTAQRGLAIFAPYFDDPEQRTFKADLTYVQLLELVKKLNRRLQRKGLPEVPVNNAGFKTSFLTHEGLTRSYNRVIKSAFTTTEIRDKQIDIPDLPYTIVNAKYLYKASNGVAKVDSSGNKKDLYYSQMDASDIPDC